MVKAKKIFIAIILNLTNVVNLAVEFITRTDHEKTKATSAQNILVVRTQAVGDFLMSLPAIQLISDTHPNANIVLLVLSGTKNPNAFKIKQYTQQKFIWRDLIPKQLIAEAIVAQAGIQNISSIKSELYKYNRTFSKCFILGENINRGLNITQKIIFLRLLNFKRQIWGIKLRANAKFFPEVQIGEGALEHHVTALINTVRECPDTRIAHWTEPRFELGISDSHRKKIRELLWADITTAVEYFVIAPGSILEFKRWPIEKFHQIAQYVINRFNLFVVISGSNTEEQWCNQLTMLLSSEPGLNGRIKNLCGKINITELSALLSGAKLLISNDGGSCHLAAAVKCPVVSIANGVEVQNSVEPWGYQHLTVRKMTACAPCYDFTRCPTGTKKCVNDITVDEVKMKVNQVLLNR